MIDQLLIRNAIARLDVVSYRGEILQIFVSIRNQLFFLANYDPQNAIDRARIRDIVFGVQAAREVEMIDMELAEILHEVSSQVRHEIAFYEK